MKNSRIPHISLRKFPHERSGHLETNQIAVLSISTWGLVNIGRPCCDRTVMSSSRVYRLVKYIDSGSVHVPKVKETEANPLSLLANRRFRINKFETVEPAL